MRQETEVMIEIQIEADQNPEILIRTEINLDQANKYNAGTMGKRITLGGNATGNIMCAWWKVLFLPS